MKKEITMATIKSYSDWQQSKKLAEILPLESADMHYNVVGDAVIGGYQSGVSSARSVAKAYKKNPDEFAKNVIPCWSLAALLSVLPNKIVSHETAFEGEDAKGITDIYYKCIEATEDDRYMFRYAGNGYMYECVADSPIDTCYEMIELLHELKML